MVEKRKAKRCPRCGTMTFIDMSRCQICGHQYKTDVVAAPPSFNPERTQMLVLPPSFNREVSPLDDAENAEPFAYIEPPTQRRSSKLPLIMIFTVVALLFIAFVVLLLHSALPSSR